VTKCDQYAFPRPIVGLGQGQGQGQGFDMLGIFLDLETTGLNFYRHCPIDIAFKVIDLSSGNRLGSYCSLIRPSKKMWEIRDLNSMEFNGMTWEELSKGKDKEVVAKEIIAALTALQIQRMNSVFICQNPSFDRGFFNQLIDVYVQELLNWPYHWLDLASMYWTRRVKECGERNLPIPEKCAFSKNEIAKYFNLPLETSPHRSMGGVDHLILCYQAVMQQ
jgi:oligoribonuclease